MNVTKMYESYLTMNNECYKIITALLENNTIVIDMEETTSCVQYKGQYTREDIEGMLTSRIHLTIDQFFDLIKAGLSKTDNHIVLTCEQGLSEGLKLNLVWTIPNSIGLNLPISFMLEIAPLIQNDTDRLNKVIIGLNEKIMNGMKRNEELSLKLNRLEMFIEEKHKNECKTFTMLIDKTSAFKDNISKIDYHIKIKDKEVDNNFVEIYSFLNELEVNIENQRDDTIHLEENIKNYSVEIHTFTDIYKNKIIEINNHIKMKDNEVNTLMEKIQMMEHKNNDTNAYIMENIRALEEKIIFLTVMKNNLVNITVYKDEERVAFENPVFTMTVNKKLSNTALLVQVSLCVHGEANAETCPILTYGNDVKTITYGQSDGYSGNTGFGRNLMCYALIKDHSHVGEQSLTMTFNDGMKPYLIKNPNYVDHSQYIGTQTCSIIKVEEIEI
jgi:hypothetical protein